MPEPAMRTNPTNGTNLFHNNDPADDDPGHYLHNEPPADVDFYIINFYIDPLDDDDDDDAAGDV